VSKSGVKVLKNDVFDVSKAMRALTMQSVLVGIPGEGGRSDEDSDLTNAEIGFIHEKGSPANNIPARPFLTPGIRAAHPQIVDQLRAAGKAALEGKVSGVNSSLERAGIIAQNSVRAQFVDNDWAELDEKTLKRRPVIQRDDEGKPTKHGKSRQERGAVNPLLDSGQLRKAVTYVVKKGK
tara:strand:+ start:18386 stop:18925 length:540 start_codon:yes stop_codon:yes gene_type:complete